MVETKHWADKYAEKIVEKKPDKEEYIVETGITPSGVVHAGNFREIITQHFVFKALKKRGEKTTYLYFWDDYDRFRKVPEGVDQSWKKYIGLPVTETPDPYKCHDSYAEHFKEEVNEELKQLNIRDLTFKSASEEYKKGTFTELIKKALENQEKIRKILNKYRKKPYGEKWIPIRVYCEECGKDTTTAEYVGGYKLKYECECGEESILNFKETPGNAKLPWRVDWPMRWTYYDVDFESSGKEHQASGGSVDTAVPICKEIFKHKPPIQPMYEFVNIKGQKEKMSSSKGNVVKINDLLEIYEPPVIQFMYTGKINKAFHIPFDEEVINIYKRFDRAEKTYFEGEDENKARRYELSMQDIPGEKPQRVPYSLCSTIAQVAESKERRKEILERTGHLEKPSEKEVEMALDRIERAGNWIEEHAPDKYIYEVKKELPEIDIDEEIADLYEEVSEKIKQGMKGKELQQFIYETAKERNLDLGEVFKTGYKLILGQEQGPRLGPYLTTFDQDFIVKRLKREN